MFLRQFLQHWLRTTARQKVVEAAQRQVAGAASAAAAGGPAEPCDFGLVFALAIEAGGLVDLLQDVTVTKGHGFTVRQGRRHGKQVVLVESGPGAENAARATHALLDAHRPGWVFSAGFAGGLDPLLRRGDLVVAQSLADGQGVQWTADPECLPPWLANVPGLHLGRLLTLDQPVRLPAEKLDLGRRHQAWRSTWRALPWPGSAVSGRCVSWRCGR